MSITQDHVIAYVQTSEAIKDTLRSLLNELVSNTKTEFAFHEKSLLDTIEWHKQEVLRLETQKKELTATYDARTGQLEDIHYYISAPIELASDLKANKNQKV